MFYHSFLLLPNGGCAVTLNKTKAYLFSNIIQPYINNEITLESYADVGGEVLFNQSAGIMLSIYKSENEVRKEFSNYTAERFINNIKLVDGIELCTKDLIEDFRINRLGTHSSSYLEKLFSTIKKQVFVIMKFDDKHLDSAYEGVIKPTIKEFGLEPLRIDEIHDSGVISEQILKNISESQYIFVDLTGERPNCYYEAGFAHALGKELILTIKKGDQVHFDLSGHRFFQWETESELRGFIRERFESLTSLQKGQSINL